MSQIIDIRVEIGCDSLEEHAVVLFHSSDEVTDFAVLFLELWRLVPLDEEILQAIATA